MPTSEYAPTITEIGARLSARTLTPSGKRVGDFTDETSPSGAQVSELIEDAVTIVSSAVGTDLDNEYWKMAKAACISYTCMSIEIGYYPESTNSQDSAYSSFKERFNQQITFLETAINQKRPNERRIVSLQQSTLVGTRGGRLDPWSNELFP